MYLAPPSFMQIAHYLPLDMPLLPGNDAWLLQGANVSYQNDAASAGHFQSVYALEKSVCCSDSLRSA